MAVLSTLFGCGDNRGGDVPRIRAAFEKYPGVHVIDVIGWDEMWPFFGPINIRADLRIGEQGRLRLCNLTPATLAGNRPFILARVGDWYPLVQAERDIDRMRFVAGCPNSVDIAPGSPFLELLPFPLNTPSEVIANYERLHQTIASWPEQPRRTLDKDGKWISFCRQRFFEEAPEHGRITMKQTKGAQVRAPRHFVPRRTSVTNVPSLLIGVLGGPKHRSNFYGPTR